MWTNIQSRRIPKAVGRGRAASPQSVAVQAIVLSMLSHLDSFERSDIEGVLVRRDTDSDLPVLQVGDDLIVMHTQAGAESAVVEARDRNVVDCTKEEAAKYAGLFRAAINEHGPFELIVVNAGNELYVGRPTEARQAILRSNAEKRAERKATYLANCETLGKSPEKVAAKAKKAGVNKYDWAQRCVDNYVPATAA